MHWVILLNDIAYIILVISFKLLASNTILVEMLDMLYNAWSLYPTLVITLISTQRKIAIYVSTNFF